jgi:hypothetical protein
MTKDQAQINFLRWVAVAHPDLYARVAQKHLTTARLGSLGWIQIVNAVLQLGSAALQKKQADDQLKLQKKTLKVQDEQLAADRANALKIALLDINAKRAANGLGPVDLQGNLIQSQSLPMPSALAPYAKAAGVASNYAPWLIGGGVALIGLFLVIRGR